MSPPEFPRENLQNGSGRGNSFPPLSPHESRSFHDRQVPGSLPHIYSSNAQNSGWYGANELSRRNSIATTGEGHDRKPTLSYASMIVEALEAHNNRLMTLGEIYAFISTKYPYFRTAPLGWKNSIRHNLSLHPFFARVARPSHLSGKGSFWKLATGSPDEIPKRVNHVSHSAPRDLHLVHHEAFFPLVLTEAERAIDTNMPVSTLSMSENQTWPQPTNYQSSGVSVPSSHNGSGTSSPMHLASVPYNMAQPLWDPLSHIYQTNVNHHQQNDLPLGEAVIASPHTPPRNDLVPTPELYESHETSQLVHPLYYWNAMLPPIYPNMAPAYTAFPYGFPSMYHAFNPGMQGQPTTPTAVVPVHHPQDNDKVRRFSEMRENDYYKLLQKKQAMDMPRNSQDDLNSSEDAMNWNFNASSVISFSSDSSGSKGSIARGHSTASPLGRSSAFSSTEIGRKDGQSPDGFASGTSRQI